MANLPIYILAVSGGVDSMCLLYEASLGKLKIDGAKTSRFIVAHFNHGIRQESKNDMQLVVDVCRRLGLPFEYAQVRLGHGASEEIGRILRYGFLHSLRLRYNATAIITAHHADDDIETSLLQILRGTGRRGLAGLGDQPYVIRPYRFTPKVELLRRAKAHSIVWHEDSTNALNHYSRNALRNELIPFLVSKRSNFVDEWQQFMKRSFDLNRQVDKVIYTHFKSVIRQQKLPRNSFVMLPHNVSKELLIALLRSVQASNINRKRLEQLTVLLKTGKIGSQYDVDKTWEFIITESLLLHGTAVIELRQKSKEQES